MRVRADIRHIIEHFDKLSVTECSCILTAYDLSLTTNIRYILEHFDKLSVTEPITILNDLQTYDLKTYDLKT